jgi:uracil-DNA glycosylase
MIYAVAIQQHDGLDEFRCAARRLLAAGVAPADIGWSNESKGSLFGEPLPIDEKTVTVPRAFVALSDAVSCHRDEQRWPLLYEALWRIDRGERVLMQQASDLLVHRLNRMAASVRRDQHRMTAFVRFRKVPSSDGEHFIAWYEPQHFILRRTSSFFVDRFTNMLFSILTPDLTLHWNRSDEQFGPGLRRQDAASEDAVENWWRRYYAAVFNPARMNARLMQQHMPKRFWRDLPEAKTILELIDGAAERTDRMIRSSYSADNC